MTAPSAGAAAPSANPMPTAAAALAAAATPIPPLGVTRSASAGPPVAPDPTKPLPTATGVHPQAPVTQGMAQHLIDSLEAHANVVADYTREQIAAHGTIVDSAKTFVASMFEQTQALVERMEKAVAAWQAAHGASVPPAKPVPPLLPVDTVTPAVPAASAGSTNAAAA